MAEVSKPAVVTKGTVRIKPFNCTVQYNKQRYPNNVAFDCDAKTAAQFMKDGHAVLATAADAPPTAVDLGVVENDKKDGKDATK